MTQRRYLQLDVFAHRPGTGNPLGVVIDSSGLDSAAMQALAAWLNLSETIFFLPVDSPGADYHIRIFTPVSELPFAGHPSVGAAWAALELGLVRPEKLHLPADGRRQLIQQCAAGPLPVDAWDQNGIRQVSVRAPRAAHRRKVASPEWLMAPTLFGAARGPLAPALYNNGPDWWLLELADEAALRAWQPDQTAIAALPGHGKLAAFARSDASKYQLVVRAFAPGVGIAEDPVTGSANASIAAYLHANGIVPGHDGAYLASQGRELGRDGVVQVRVDDDGEVWIGGLVQHVIHGQLRW